MPGEQDGAVFERLLRVVARRRPPSAWRRHSVPRSAAGVCVVGSGTRFLSGISVYTLRLANALAEARPVSVVTMRQLLPTRLYPGRTRVGQALSELRPDPRVDVFDGVDWYWLPSIVGAVVFLVRRRPRVVVLQWWTASVLHTYLALALVARLLGARLVIEFHEILDTGEVRLSPVRAYVGLVAPLLFRQAAAFTVHSDFDRDLLRQHYRLGRRPVVALPHGPHDHALASSEEGLPALREAPAGACNLLFFGVIRPYKGLEDLIAAFDSIPDDEVGRYWLTVVGETWEGWTTPAEMIERSRHRDRITFVNRYVHDRELDAYMRGADAVVLPYHRASTSGPAHMTMALGLPLVITAVGGNPWSVSGYEGALLIPPAEPAAIQAAIRRVADMAGRRFRHPSSWQATAEAYEALFERLGLPSLRDESAPTDGVGGASGDSNVASATPAGGPLEAARSE